MLQFVSTLTWLFREPTWQQIQSANLGYGCRHLPRKQSRLWLRVYVPRCLLYLYLIGKKLRMVQKVQYHGTDYIKYTGSCKTLKHRQCKRQPYTKSNRQVTHTLYRSPWSPGLAVFTCLESGRTVSLTFALYVGVSAGRLVGRRHQPGGKF